MVAQQAAAVETAALASCWRLSLAAEVGRRGWHALPVAAGGGSSGEWIRRHVDRGRPVVALVEVRPHRYHYLVIVAWTGEQVVAHDPARAPFRVMPRAPLPGNGGTARVDVARGLRDGRVVLSAGGQAPWPGR